MEIWKRGKKFNDYEMSTEGKVRNAKTGRILKTTINKRGYEEVSLRKDNRQHTQRVHNLIADTFIDGDHTGLDVRHKNDDRSDNRASNLEYCTRSETVRRGHDRGNVKAPRPNPTRVRVVETGEIYDSLRECASSLGISLTGVCKCVNGAAYTCGGFHFEKVD